MSQITEARNPSSHDLDLMSTEEVLHLINTEDHAVPSAVRQVIPALARAIEAVLRRNLNGGRIFYVGAGTSGRLGVLDASEIPPTFGVGADVFQAVIAGGYAACHSATEASEDDAARGARDLEARGCRTADIVVGIAASGETPYTRGALEWARKIGALTIAICSNPESSLSRLAEYAVTPIVGPEVLSGSTRMKAGTAQKLVLNMFSTAIMIRLGYVYSNWMVNVKMTNSKLKARGLRILEEATGLPEAHCRAALEAAGDLKVALVMLLGQTDLQQAQNRLIASKGNVRNALQDMARS
jgi:N-acetylmuramic acid 6-phosphate etherase